MSVKAIKPAWIYCCDFCHTESTQDRERIPEQWETIKFGSPAYQATRMLACWPCARKVIQSIKANVQAKP